MSPRRQRTRKRSTHERLSASDMSSLFAERGAIHVNVGGTIVVQGRAPEFERLLAQVERRLSLVPRFRQRITEVPLELENPVWADDPDFDLRRHVRHSALPRPGTEAQLRDYFGRVMSEPLDMEHPLWQLYLVEGLKGGRHALISKSHHALVDGVSAVDVGMLLLDVDAGGSEVSPEKWEPTEADRGELFAAAASDFFSRPFRAAGRAARTAVTMPRETAARVARTFEAFSSMAASGPKCPPSFLNMWIGRDRRVAWAKTELEVLKRARGDDGATVNDVVLAVAAGALRRLFKARRVKMPEHLVALVPVSIRRPEEQHELGNRITTILVPLPIAERNPRKRLRLIRERTERLKRSERARAASLLIDATGWAPPTINRLLSHAMARPLVFNLVVSNVPGPQQPLYLMGRRLREIYPYVPLSPQNHGISIGVLSYDGDVFFGIVGDRDLMPDLERMSEWVDEALAEQLAAAERPAKKRAPARTRPRPTRG